MSEHVQLQFLHEVDKLSEKYAKTINLLFAGNKVFVTYQTKMGVLTPNPLRTPLADDIKTMVSEKVNHRGTRSMLSGRKVCKMW